jgi:hypothetical protein
MIQRRMAKTTSKEFITGTLENSCDPTEIVYHGHVAASNMILKCGSRLHRGEIIAALLTLVRAWYDAGQPPMKEPIKMGSFQTWVNIIGGILDNGFVDGAPG